LITSVRIQRFKSIPDMTVPLSGLTLLVGPNNAGKSSVLQAIQFATSVCQSLELDNVSRWSGDERSGTLSAEQLIYTPLRDVHALALGGRLKQESTTAIRVELTDTVLGVVDIAVSRGKNKNIAVRVNGRELGERLSDLDNPFSVVAPGLAGIPSYEEYRAQGVVRRSAARGDANSVFRNVLLTLKGDTEAWDTFHDSLHEVFHDIDVVSSLTTTRASTSQDGLSGETFDSRLTHVAPASSRQYRSFPTSASTNPASSSSTSPTRTCTRTTSGSWGGC
jgi:hypothetical protein